MSKTYTARRAFNITHVPYVGTGVHVPIHNLHNFLWSIFYLSLFPTTIHILHNLTQ